MPRLLTKKEIEKRIANLDGWNYQKGFITKSFEFGRFLEGIRFVDQIATVAEEQEHHPDIHVRYTTVRLSLQTHSQEGVTVWDVELAEAIDRLPVRGLVGGKKSR
ncbi:MAG: 4a-hydroxytetrahydrobiopterin dehydratase [Thaumarchaeota archaeon]|nr:4a-hydroxytetrahydrobiopterin dehydratase [Nitrososphaerota archaeon]